MLECFGSSTCKQPGVQCYMSRPAVITIPLEHAAAARRQKDQDKLRGSDQKEQSAMFEVPKPVWSPLLRRVCTPTVYE